MTNTRQNHERTASQQDLMDLVLRDIEKTHAHQRTDLAETAKVSASTLNGWASGKVKNPRLDTICRVAEALGYRLTWEKHGVASVSRRPAATAGAGVHITH